MSTVRALELNSDAAGVSSIEGLHFVGFPGVWYPGQPVALTELGFDSEEDALAAAAELDLPLDEVQADAADAHAPARDNHLLSDEQQRALMLDAAASWPPRTHADADAAAAAAGVDWPEEKMKLDAKVELLDRLRDTGAGAPVEAAE